MLADLGQPRRRERVGYGAARRGRIAGIVARDPEQALGLAVVRLQLVVAVRPGRAGITHHVAVAGEVALAKPQGDAAVVDRRPAHARVAADQLAVAAHVAAIWNVPCVRRGELERRAWPPRLLATRDPVA